MVARGLEEEELSLAKKLLMPQKENLMKKPVWLANQ
jgi:hypothetical protein